MFLSGLLMSCFGIPATIWAARILYVLDTKSNVRLTGGLSEENIAAVAIIGCILSVVGIILMIFGKAKRKNQEISDSISNSSKLLYCTQCKINVEVKDGKCPICNQQIRR